MVGGNSGSESSKKSTSAAQPCASAVFSTTCPRQQQSYAGLWEVWLTALLAFGRVLDTATS